MYFNDEQIKQTKFRPSNIIVLITKYVILLRYFYYYSFFNYPTKDQSCIKYIYSDM